jgi:hypothetical protein
MAVLQGCSAGFQRSAPEMPGGAVAESWRVVRGDWSDVEAAMEVSAARAEVAVVSSTLTPGLIVFEVLAATDEAGEVVVTREGGVDGGTGEDVPIRLEARVGRFRDRVREGRLLDALSRRLEQLRGRAVAPVSW